MNSVNRRVFMKSGALALLALGFPPDFVTRSLFAETRHAKRKTIICIFQRGAVDGLNMVVPYGEQAYYRVRRAIAVPAPGQGQGQNAQQNSAIDLNGFFGLHPSLQPLHELWTRNEMAIVHAVGSPHPTRSHFDAQDFMETATPGDKTTRDGWLNRVLQETRCAECDGRTLANPAAHAADHAAGQVALAQTPFRGVAMTKALPRALQGQFPALAIPDFANFGVTNGRDAGIESTMEKMYRTDQGDAISAAGRDAFDAMAILNQLRPNQYRPRDGVTYPAGDFGRSLRQIAQLIKADVGLEIAFADIGGWDTHSNQGGATGQLPTRLTELARGIRALYDDLGDAMEDVVLVTMSEFGRTVAENGSGGTDHGHANCMLILGGSVAGGKVYGKWPGLEKEQLYQGRDLELTSDFRDVFAEVASKHLGASRLEKVFPDFTVDSGRFHGLLT
jgi:uncharacterized protein (DUF1501 family)